MVDLKAQVLFQKMPGCDDIPDPKYLTSGSAGMDLCAAVDEPIEIQPGEITFIKTGLKISLPEGLEAQIRPRSGLALKHGISLVNTPGTVDADYRGEIGLIMINFGTSTFTVHRGDRVAQMVLNQVVQAELLEVECLDETERSDRGFGHTGV